LKEKDKKIIELEAKVDANNFLIEELSKINGLIAKQGKTIKDIHDRLSPKQTIGLALLLGFAASIIGAAIYKFVVEPVIINAVNATNTI